MATSKSSSGGSRAKSGARKASGNSSSSTRQRKSSGNSTSRSGARRSTSPSSRSNGRSESSKRRTGPAAALQQGKAAATQAAEQVADSGKEATAKVGPMLAKAKGPALAAGAAAAGLAGGMALRGRSGNHRPMLSRRRVLGIPVQRKTAAQRAIEVVGAGAKQVGSVSRRVSVAADDMHALREQLERSRGQSPLEVVLDGLTHRRGQRQ